MRGREKLDNSVYVERYLAVTKFMAEHNSATIAYACSVLNIPVNGYYKGKELVDKGVVILKDKKKTMYTELTEPVFYLGSWFIPQVTYPITPRLRS
jgi:hypothetical protein